MFETRDILLNKSKLLLLLLVLYGWYLSDILRYVLVYTKLPVCIHTDILTIINVRISYGYTHNIKAIVA